MAEIENPEAQTRGVWLAWAASVFGWLYCAGAALLALVELEAYPYAYDMALPGIVLILFLNILIFLFIASRWGKLTKNLFGAVFRVCIGESLLFGGLFALGKCGIGA